MLKIAYLANQFPSPVEPYVGDEIGELRRHGVQVVPCSVRRPSAPLAEELTSLSKETLFVQPLNVTLALRALWLCWQNAAMLKDLFSRLFLYGDEPLRRRGRPAVHTFFGAYYSLQLHQRGVQHIHVHHGYFASWIAMVAARLLGITFSITLHGSDLLCHPSYLDLKLKHCSFCTTISEFNRRYLLERYSEVNPGKIMLHRLGTAETSLAERTCQPDALHPTLRMLAVGRLHPVKDHAFLLHACWRLKQRGLLFLCQIAGEGIEKRSLEQLIRRLNLQGEVELLGHLDRAQLDAHYAASDLIVLTSRSEGIPLVLMEAMERGKTVLAPDLNGIPELVENGKTGFLYRPGSLDSFIAQVEIISRSKEWPRSASPKRTTICERAFRSAEEFREFRQGLYLADLRTDRKICRRQIRRKQTKDQ